MNKQDLDAIVRFIRLLREVALDLEEIGLRSQFCDQDEIASIAEDCTRFADRCALGLRRLKTPLASRPPTRRRN